MTDETDTMGEVARVLGEHYPDQTPYDAGDLQGCMCGWQVPAPRTYGESDWAAYYAHQAAMLAEAGLLRPQIAASVPAGQPAAGSAGRGGSGGVGGACGSAYALGGQTGAETLRAIEENVPRFVAALEASGFVISLGEKPEASEHTPHRPDEMCATMPCPVAAPGQSLDLSAFDSKEGA